MNSHGTILLVELYKNYEKMSYILHHHSLLSKSLVYFELSEEDRLTVARARKVERFLSQPFFVAEIFTGSPGEYVSLEDTIKGFNMVLTGELDDLPEQSFYLVGNIDQVIAKAETLK